MTTFVTVAQLKELLLGMERELGVSDLGYVQKDILYVVSILPKSNGVFETDEIRSHHFLKGVSRSSFFRAMKDVVNAGYLNHCEGTKRSSYKLTAKLKIKSKRLLFIS